MKTISATNLAVMLAFGTLCFSCKKEALTPAVQQPSQVLLSKNGSDGLKISQYFGKPIKMGNGTARAFITVLEGGEPLELGVEMNRNAIFNLPEEHAEASYLLSLPQEAKSLTAIDHIVINWNAHGHPPIFYKYPHYDFHFYTTSIAERLAIPTYTANPAGFDNDPAAGFLPPNYMAPPGGEEAQMGKHWVDLTSPELQPNGAAQFTKTFIYGSYNGQVTFYEPMITQALLESGVSPSTPIPQPSNFAEHKFYATKYNIYRSSGNQKHNVTLSNFVLR